MHEKAPDANQLLLNDSSANDDEAADEAAAALAAVDSEIGRTTDPVRMYTREMGTVELLTRAGEIAIAKRIEEGLRQVLGQLSRYPPAIELQLAEYEAYTQGDVRLNEIMVKFIDPADLEDTEIPTPAQIKAWQAAKDSGEAQEEVVEDTGPDLEEVRKHFSILRRHFPPPCGSCAGAVQKSGDAVADCACL